MKINNGAIKKISQFRLITTTLYYVEFLFQGISNIIILEIINTLHGCV